MPAIPRLNLWYIDRDGNERQTGISFPSLSSVPEAISIANALADTIAPLTNARLFRAQWVITVPPTVQTQATAQTNIYERLVVLFTDGITYASYSIPAPAALPYDTQGPLRGVRLQEGANAASDAINQLQQALSGTLLPDGSPFPTGRWVAGRTANQ